MSKAIVSNRIYMPADAKLQKLIDKELTYTIPSYNPMDPPTIIKNMGKISSKIITVPVGRFDLVPEEYEIVDKRTISEIIFPKFKFDLRDSQAKVYNSVEDNAMINAFVSWGKTFTALAIAAKLGQKTLVVVHTLALRNQWVEEIEKCFDIKAGIIGSGKFDTEPMIVVANIQTLSKKIKEVSQLFGTLILDECLDYENKITTKEYGQRSIGTIVNNKEKHEVLSFNETTKQFEWKPILRWFKNPQKEDMIKFTFNNQSTLKCTLNHTIYSYNKGKTEAGYVEENDYIIANKSFKSSNILTEEIKPLVLGMILGDGSLSTNKTSCRLGITHGEAQRKYLEYKRNILKEAFPSKIVKGSSGYKKDNNVFSTSSLSFYDIDNWRAQLYGKNTSKSYITKEISELLNIDSWAIMYQDDGSISKGKYVTFSFCELNESSLALLQNSLQKLFNIIGTQYIHKGFRYLRLNKKESEVFIHSIEHLIHPVLEYKKGILGTGKPFRPYSPMKVFEDYTILKVIDVSFEKATYGFRYNIEVADNHNYLAGHKLVSNCHHVSAPTFANIVDKSSARYKIGLSGTLQRKDGKHIIFNDYFGFDVHQPPKENYITPRVQIVKTDIRFPDGAKTPWAKRVNAVAYNENYQHLVSMLASTYAAKGHKVLVVSDRVQFLKRCTDLTGDNAVCITGELNHVEREEELNKIKDGTADILYGSQNIFSEGISVNELSCLILGTPVNNRPLLTQLIGRVIRKLEGKQQPVVVDIHLKGSTASRQAKERSGVYLSEGYEIQTIAV